MATVYVAGRAKVTEPPLEFEEAMEDVWRAGGAVSGIDDACVVSLALESSAAMPSPSWVFSDCEALLLLLFEFDPSLPSNIMMPATT